MKKLRPDLEALVEKGAKILFERWARAVGHVLTRPWADMPPEDRQSWLGDARAILRLVEREARG